MSKVKLVLEFLASRERNEIGQAWTTGKEIQDGTDMIPADINDAIEIAENRGFLEVLKTLGTAPFKFHSVTITAEGRLWLESD
mgnify:CR=1 FL=1